MLPWKMLPWKLLCPVVLLTLCQGQDSGTDEEESPPACDNFTDLDFHETFLGTSLSVRLLLYTRAAPTCGRQLPPLLRLPLATAPHRKLTDIMEEGASLSSVPPRPSLNLSLPTAFIIHGYRPTGAPPVWVDHMVALLLQEDELNVVVVDWNRGAANLNYLTAVANTRQAADNLTGFILSMQEEGASLSSVHLLGVSLGAHLAGFVGANLKGKIGRITGLDPAGPMFTGAQPEERLDPSDAMFVDVLHTDMNSFGLSGTHGHIDYYANGGADQPGCPKTIFAGKSYFVCDHQRSVFLFLCALNRTCSLTGYPCASYNDFLDGRCLQCEAFKPHPCPMLGYDVSRWRDTLLSLGQTKAYFSTTATLPYRKLSYRVDLVTWNQYLRWGVVFLRLHSGRNVTETRIGHKLFRFEQYTSTRLLAQFDHDLQPVHKISLRIATGNVIGPRYKLRLLRIRLTPLDRPGRPLMCRYDIIMEENMEVSFRPLPCTPDL